MSRVKILLKVRCNLILSSLRVIRLRIYLSPLSTKAGEEFPVGGEVDNEGHVQTFAEMPIIEKGYTDLVLEEILICLRRK